MSYLPLDHMIKQTSFSVSSNMNWIVCSVLISVHILFNLERYLLNTWKFKWEKSWLRKSKILKIGYMVLILCSTKEKYIFWLNWYYTLCVYQNNLYILKEKRENLTYVLADTLSTPSYLWVIFPSLTFISRCF